MTEVRVPVARYPWPARLLHWGTVLAVGVAFLAMWVGKDLAGGRDGRAAVEQVHYWAGLAILAMVVLRLALRPFYRAPPVQPPLPAAMRWAAHAVHAALYGLLLVQTTLGLATLADEGEALWLPSGAWTPPQWLSDAARALDKAEDLHGAIAWLLLATILAHVGAALWHHLVRRDDTLRRML